jgi:hypothetical protein
MASSWRALGNQNSLCFHTFISRFLFESRCCPTQGGNSVCYYSVRCPNRLSRSRKCNVRNTSSIKLELINYCLLQTLHGWRSRLFLPTVTITHLRTSTICSSCSSTTTLLQRTPLSCRLRVSPTTGWRGRMAPSLRIRVFQAWTP